MANRAKDAKSHGMLRKKLPKSILLNLLSFPVDLNTWDVA